MKRWSMRDDCFNSNYSAPELMRKTPDNSRQPPWLVQVTVGVYLKRWQIASDFLCKHCEKDVETVDASAKDWSKTESGYSEYRDSRISKFCPEVKMPKGRQKE